MSGALGILGGTFDPIHCGHVHAAHDVRAGLRLSRVLLVPAGDPWHRAPPGASAAHRVAMARLAVRDEPGLEVDAREASRPGPTYTVDTLEELRRAHPLQPLALIVGADAFLGFPRWHRWREVFALAHVVVVARPGVDIADALPEVLAQQWAKRLGTDPAALENPAGGSIYRQAIAPHPISATAIRAALAAGDVEAVRGLLPASVLDYILRHRLYRNAPDVR